MKRNPLISFRISAFCLILNLLLPHLTHAALSSNADLAALTLNASPLTPNFAPATTVYAASVNNATANVTITPTTADAAATIQVRVNAGNYATVLSGNASAALTLMVGNNLIEAKVTASDLTTIKTYTINVCRAATIDAIANQSICKDSISPSITLTGSATMYSWTNSNTAIGLGSSGIGNIPAFTAINNTNAPVSATVTATPQIGTPSVAYTANYSNHTVSAISTVNQTVIATIPVGTNPTSIAVSPNGMFVYVAHQDNRLFVISTSNNTVLTTIPVAYFGRGIVVSADGSRIYVAHSQLNQVSVINGLTNTLITTITVGTRPNGMVLSPNGNLLYVANTTSGTLSIINTTTNTVSNTVTLAFGNGIFSLAISPDGNRLYIGNIDWDYVSIFNTATQTILATLGVGDDPTHLAINSAGSRVYATNTRTDDVSVINTLTSEVIATIPVNDGPNSIGISNDGNHLYVVNGYSSNVSVIHATTHAILNTISLPSGAYPTSFGKFITVPVLNCSGTPTTFTLTVKPTATLTMAITTGSRNSCAGTTVTFTASPIAAGANATFQWRKNGINIPNATNSTFSSNALATNDAITCVMNTNDACGSPVTSNSITMTSNPLPTIQPVTNQTLCAGTQTTPIAFTGTGASYTWTNSHPAIGLAANGTGNLSAFTTANNTGMPITATLTATPISNSSVFAYVANEESANVSVLNANTQVVTATIPVGQYPHGVAANAEGSFVYVSNVFSHTVSVISTATNTVTATISVGRYPTGIAVSPNGSRVYMTHIDASEVSVLNTVTNQIIATIPVGSSPKGICVSPDGSRVYVSNRGSNHISIIDATTNTVLTTVAVNSFPSGIALNPNGSRLYVVNESSYNVSVINTTNNTIVATIPVGWTPQGISVNADGSRVYVANQASNSVSVINANTNTVITAITVGSDPYGVSLNPDGSRLYVTNKASNNVSVINTATNTVLSTVAVGTSPRSMGNFVATTIQGCAGTPATFNIIVNPVVTPTVAITAPNQTICANTSVTFTASPTNAGGTPTYQWRKNGGAISGATNATFTSASLAHNDVITCAVTSDAACRATGISNSLTMTVNAIVTPTVSIAITAGNRSICVGTSVTFSATAVNGGLNPTYQWQKNGVAISGATNAGYTSTTLANNDTISCVLTSNAFCATTATATSSVLVMTVLPKPVVNFTYVVAGGLVTFTNTSTAGTSNWAFGDANNSTSAQSNPTFTYAMNGTYQVTLDVIAANNCTARMTQTIQITRVGVNDLSEALKIKVLPNPFSESLSITIENSAFSWDAKAQLMVTNGMGQLIYQTPLNQKTISLNTLNWSEGIYNICLYTNGIMIPIQKSIKIAQ